MSNDTPATTTSNPQVEIDRYDAAIAHYSSGDAEAVSAARDLIENRSVGAIAWWSQMHEGELPPPNDSFAALAYGWQVFTDRRAAAEDYIDDAFDGEPTDADWAKAWERLEYHHSWFERHGLTYVQYLD